MKKLIFIHLLTILAFGYYACTNIQKTTPTINPSNYEIHGVDQKLVKAIIHVESSGRPHVVSSDGCIGLMQLNPRYWVKGCGLSSKSELFNPKTNVKCGTYVLKHYLEKQDGNIRKALEMYHGGYSVGAKSKAYALKVLNKYQEL